MERTEDFDKADWGLPRLAVEQWQGFVFVNLDPETAPLAPTLASYEPYLDHYQLDLAVCPGTFTLEAMPWNWKVMFENLNDGPHIDGGFNATHHAIMAVFPDLTEAERTRSTFALIPPTLYLGTAPDQASFFLVHPTGPETIEVEIGYLFHPTALDDPLFEHKLKLADVGVQVFVEQDQDATTKVQRGLRSRFARRGRYSWQEESHVNFDRWLAKRYREQPAAGA